MQLDSTDSSFSGAGPAAALASKRKTQLVTAFAATVVVFTAVAVMVFYFTHIDDESGSDDTFYYYKTDCLSEIYCKGKVLETIQLAEVFEDQKEFVDRNVRSDVTIASLLDEFDALWKHLGANRTAALAVFVAKYFSSPGDALRAAPPAPDFAPQPSALAAVRTAELRRFAFAVHAMWPNLTKVTTDGECTHASVAARPYVRSSLLCLPRSFVIAAGRFREMYYWDEYFISLGLIASGLRSQVENTIENFAALVAALGFVPNGSRVYYLSRSQPPFFIQLVKLYLDAYGYDNRSVEFIGPVVPQMLREHAFWLDKRGVVGGSDIFLHRFGSSLSSPRAESFKEDYDLNERRRNEEKGGGGGGGGGGAGVGGGDADESEQSAFLYNNVGAGAESGQDFSSRFFANRTDMTTIRTTRVVPVDLNALLLNNELFLAELCAHAAFANATAATAGLPCDAALYADYAARRRRAMETYLRTADGQWRDAVVDNDGHVQPAAAADGGDGGGGGAIYAAPLIFAHSGDAQLSNATAAAQQLAHTPLLDAYGLRTSSLAAHATGQQWDGANGWPNFQFLYHSALLRAGEEQRAAAFAAAWLRSNYCAWSGVDGELGLNEKMNVSAPCGSSGHGGEYKPQIGFGWSNGVVLHLLSMYAGDERVDTVATVNCSCVTP